MLTAPKAQLERITPQMAREMLSRNTRNRPLSQLLVRRYAEAMKRGEWKLNYEPIQTDENDGIMNGQHRLHGLILADMTLPFFVVRGLSASISPTIDVGKRRSTSDVFSMTHSLPNSAATAAAIRMLWHIEQGRLGIDTRPTETQLLEALDRHATIPTYRSLGERLWRETKINATVAQVFAYLVSGYREAEPFFTGLATGTNLCEGDPRIAFRRNLMNQDPLSRSGMLRQRIHFYSLVKTWNAYILDKPVKMIAFKKDEDDIEIMPGTLM